MTTTIRLTNSASVFAMALLMAALPFVSKSATVEWGVSNVDYTQIGYDGGLLCVIGRPYLNIRADAVGTALVLTAMPDLNLENANTFVRAASGDVVDRDYISSKGEYFAWADYDTETVRTDYTITLDETENVYLAFVADSSSYDGVRYGWMELGLDEDGSLKVYSSAWDIDGDAIAVGVVPEPTTGLLMMLGIATLALRRAR